MMFDYIKQTMLEINGHMKFSRGIGIVKKIK